MNSKNTVKGLIKKIFVSSFSILVFFAFTNSAEAFNPLAYVKNIYNSYIDNLSYFFTPFTQVATPILSSTSAKTTTTIVTKTISTPAPIVKVASPIISEATFISALEKVLNRKDIQDQLRGPQGPAGTSSRFVGQGGFESPHVFFSITNADITKLNVTGNSTLANLTVSGALTAQSITGTLDPNLTLGSVLFQGATGIAEDNTNLFWDDTNDRLGVGTTEPGAPLQINSSIGGEILKIYGTSTNSDAYLTINTFDNARSKTIFFDGSTDWYAGITRGCPTASDGQGFSIAMGDYCKSSSVLYIGTDGNVGIGTTEPSASLTVVGQSITSSNSPNGLEVYAADGYTPLVFGGFNGGGIVLNAGDGSSAATMTYYGGNGGDIQLRAGDGGFSPTINRGGAGGSFSLVTGNGGGGAGGGNPGTINIQTGVSGGGLVGGDISINTGVGSVSAGNLILNSDGGNVGIGTVAPETNLDINSSVYNTSVAISPCSWHGSIVGKFENPRCSRYT